MTALLRRRALAKFDTESLQLHRLVAALLRERALINPASKTTATVALRILAATVPTDPRNDLDSWLAWRQLLPHVLAITDEKHNLASNDTGSKVAWLLGRAAAYLGSRGEPRPAVPLATRAHYLYRMLKGDDHPDSLTSATRLADRLSAVGEYEQARGLAEDTLRRQRRLFGDDHPATLRSASSLAIQQGALGEHEQARALHEDTLTRRRRVFGEDDPETLRSANNLAVRMAALGEYEQARALHEDTLTRRRRVLGDDHPDTLRSARSLAADLAALG